MEKVKLITLDGRHLLQLADGTIIPGLVWTRVYDGAEKGEAHAIIKVLVEIIDEPIKPLDIEGQIQNILKG